MSNETITIYSAVDLSHKEIIPIADKEVYLNCKFWQVTQDDAIKFSNFYRGPVRCEAFRTIAILNNGILNWQNIQSLNDNTVWLLTSGFDLPNNILVLLAALHLNILHYLDELWSDIYNDKSYPSEHLIDDILPWAENKKLIDAEKTSILRKEILATRCPVFINGNVAENLRIKIAQMFINSNYGYIFYNDAIELLLLEENILPELIVAINAGEIAVCFTKDKKNCYLYMESLLKWLMKHGQFPNKWIEDFKQLKIQSLNESALPAPQTFTIDQLRRFLEKYYSGNEDIYYHINSGIYHAYINMRDGANCSYLKNRQSIQIKNHTYKIRYLNLERLLSPLSDPHHITKNLLDETPIKASKRTSYIFLDSTREEYSHGLQRILSLKKENVFEAYHELTCQDLRFIADEVKRGLKKHLTSGKNRQKIATESGKVSGEVRREDKDNHWFEIKEEALEVAESHKGASLNKIAEVIKQRGITTKSVRSISRYIEDDPSFKPYLKKRNKS